MTAALTRLRDFPASVRFLDRPRLRPETALAGQVVAVLFWRVGCIDSRQALAELAELQRRYAERPFAVLAVHVPTSRPEQSEDRVRRNCAHVRDAVTIAIDPERELAGAFAVTATPWLALADAEGKVVFSARGAPNRMKLKNAIDTLLAAGGEAGRLAQLPLMPPRPPKNERLGICALASDGPRLWVAAAERHCILALTTDGAIEHQFAGFELPAGLQTLDDGRLLVSDAGTHELCLVDPHRSEVATVLGTGFRGTDTFGGSFGEDQPLCSPAGLATLSGAVYFAQAGGHQVWQFDPETQAASAWLGAGQRGLLDGGDEAAFAEPWGVACTEDTMFVADAGNDAVRAVELAHNFVRTIAQDVPRPTAVALRTAEDVASAATPPEAPPEAHPESLAIPGDELFVAASWQPAVLRMSTAGGVRTVVGGPEHGLVEPTALAFHRGELWVADPGADALFAIDVDAEPPTVRRVELQVQATEPQRGRGPASGTARLAQPIDVLEFSDVTLRIHLPIAAGDEFDLNTSCEVDLADEADPILAAPRHAMAEVDGEHVEVLVPIDDRGDGVLRVRVRAQVCRGEDGSPSERVFRYLVPVRVGVQGGLEAEVRE